MAESRSGLARTVSTVTVSLDLLASSVARLTGWRRAGVAFVAGAVSLLAMAPFHFQAVLFLTLPVFVWLIDGSAPRPDLAVRHASWLRWSASGAGRAAGAGWWFGFGYFLPGLLWIGEAFLVEAEVFAWLLPFAVTLLPAGMALYFALAAGAARSVWPAGLARVVVLAIALAASEWLRGHLFTGFPWNVLGYALTWPLVLMQSAGMLGIYTLTAWAVIIFAAPLVGLAAAAGPTGGLRVRAAILMSALPLALLAIYGAVVLDAGPARSVPDVALRIVQPSIPQREKWQPDNQNGNFTLHLDLSRHNQAGEIDDLAGITHLIWPEAAMPFLPLDHPQALLAIGQLLPDETRLLAGALRLDRRGTAAADGSARATARPRAYNSLLVLGSGGNLIGLYDKIHLVPFGEFLPFQETLEAIGLEQITRQRGGFTPGPEPRPLLEVAGLPPVEVLICYEAIFPQEVVQGAARPGLLLNVTNDGWFGHTIGPYQHFHQSRVRAVEQGLPLIRAANNGITAMIDGHGRVLGRLELDARGVLDVALPQALSEPPYARFGGWIFLSSLVFFALGLALVRRRMAA